MLWIRQKPYEHMLKNFADNVDSIEYHNSLNLSYKLGLNQFSGMSFEEWKTYMGLHNQKIPSIFASNHSVHKAPMEGLTLP